MTPKRNFDCPVCGIDRYSNVSLQKHLAEVHYCYTCRDFVLNKGNHRCVQVQYGSGIFDPSPFILSQAGLDSFQVFTLNVHKVYVTVEKLVRKYYNDIYHLLTQLLSVNLNIKARLVIRCHLVHQKTEEEKIHDIGSTYDQLYNTNQIKRLVFIQTSNIIRRLNFYNENGSSWAVLKLPNIFLHSAKLVPLKIGQSIPTPVYFKEKNGLVNFTDKDNMCFIYCMIARYKNFTTVKDAKKMNIYKDFMRENYDEANRCCKYINFTCLQKPGRVELGAVELEDIVKFEKFNPLFSVNVFSHAGMHVYPLQISKKGEQEFHADLLLLTDVTNDIHHFVLILDFNTFMSDGRKRFYCKRCLHSFGKKESLIAHLKICSDYTPQRISFPDEDNITYTVGGNEFAQQFYAVADFETYMEVC